MIGVVASASTRSVVAEFFELFKTPWEFARPNRRYPVGLVVGEECAGLDASLLFIFGSNQNSWDLEHGLGAQPCAPPVLLSQGKHRMLVYGQCAAFENGARTLVSSLTDGRAVAVEIPSASGVVIRVGYNLFEEVQNLLTAGQPEEHAAIPALDHHIAFLREIILENGHDLVEVPPVPFGYAFTACLTHDVDHPGLRFHKWDHTMAGFLYRATLGSLISLIRGRLSPKGLLRNVWAVTSLPLVHLGWKRDPWNTFGRYLQLEEGFPSTFFVIPVKNRPGVDDTGVERPLRASGYGAEDIGGELKQVSAAGCEIGLHGIDAWRDPAAGENEKRVVSTYQSGSEVGIRMHWLYFGRDSHRVLEQAGFSYDSTVGYNGTVGCRSGTFQAYKPLNARTLLEIPLHIMDTALFYPAHLGLAKSDARERIRDLAKCARELGGVLTVNWHDRSIAPERCWDGLYKDIIREWRDGNAWFSTMGQTARWYRRRRSVRFNCVEDEAAGRLTVEVEVDAPVNDDIPPLTCRVHRAVNCDGRRDRSFHDQRLDRECRVSPGAVCRAAA